MRKEYTVLFRYSDRPKRRRDNNIKVNLKYNVNMYCELAHDRLQRIY